ncbi:helix-turn-helix domain-containing protein [Bdellovibrio sp. HCB337]|uniref:helix-turn-helix domain-containing protein n=1 Tax=Bdellovibrio sp. HCB337 TaxID=3394358 RepID=UPI0039A4F743
MSKADENKTVSKLSVFLREKRMRADLSQAKVARILGYSTAQFVSNWERGISEPPLETLKVLAKLYSVSVDEMFEVVLKSTIQKVTEDLKEKFKHTK